VVNPGRAGLGPGSTSHRERRVSIKILVAAAVLLASGLMVTLTATAKAARKPCGGRAALVSIAVSPDIAPAVAKVGQLFNSQHHVTAGHCAEVTIVPAPPATVASVLDGQGPARGLPAVAAWIPDSSLWVDVARSFPIGARDIQPSGIDVARSPLMIVMPPGAAARVPAFGASVGWNFLLPPSDGGPPASQRLRVELPDPTQSAAGLATLVEIGRLLGSGAAARTAFARFVFASEATYQIEGPQALTPFLALAEPPLDGNPVTVIPEQEVLQYDSTHPGQALAARYPLTATSALGSPELNYPYVITVSQPAELTIVREFGQLLGQGYAAGVLRFDGFRSAGDVADAAPGKYGLATQLLQIATPPASSEAQTALQAWQQLDINYKDLALIDVSAAMAAPAGPGGVTLEQELAQAAGLGLSLFPDSTNMGLWEFADKLSGAQPYRQLVSVGPLTGELGLISRREQLIEANQSVKPLLHSPAALNEAILAGYKHLLASYQPKSANAVLVLTSGADNARDDISLSELLAQLHRLSTPDRPVQVVIIMFGIHGNFGAMQQIAAATAGTAYEITNPAQIGKVFFEAIAQRICPSGCRAP
jgi:hypothetical protein